MLAGALALATGLAAPAAQAAGPVRLFAGLTADDPAIPAALVARTELQLEAALRRGVPGRLDVRIALPKGGKLPPAIDRELAEAHADLAAGLDRYLDMRMGDAATRLERARDRFIKRLGWLGSADPFVQASLYLAMARLADGNEGACQRLRLPDEDLPLSEFPPELADLLDIGRSRLKARSRLTVAATPPGAHVIVDGRLKGRAPLTIEGLTEGRHAIRIEAPGFEPWVRQIDVGSGAGRQPVRLEEAPARLGPAQLLEATGADAVIIGRITRSSEGQPVLAVARIDRSRQGFGAIAIRELDLRDARASIDEVAGVVGDPDSPPPTAEELASWEGGDPLPTDGDSAHLTLSVGGGAGLAEQVSDPGVAPVPLVLALTVSTPLDGGWEAVGVMRGQVLSPRAYMAVAGGRYRPGGPDGHFGLLLGGAFGQIAHTITDTETQRPSVAGTVGVAGGLGLVVPVGGQTVSVDLLGTTLRPDFTVHVDLLVGAQIRL